MNLRVRISSINSHLFLIDIRLPSEPVRLSRSLPRLSLDRHAALNHLLAAAGFELKTQLVLRPVEGSHMLQDTSRTLQLTPEQRHKEVKYVLVDTLAV